MATLTKRVLRNGTINYAIQIKVKGVDGKSKFVCTTWKNENKLTGIRAEKAAIAYAETWEKEYKNGHIHELSMCNFNQFANIWLKTRRYSMSDNYYIRARDCIARLSNFFGSKRFVDLKAYDVQQFFVYMNDSVFITNKARIKKSKQEEFDNLTKEYGIRKASQESNFNRPTLYYARKAEIIDYTSAKVICGFYNISINEYFDKITTEKHYRKETIMKYKRVLSSIYNYALTIELVDRNYATSAYLKNVIGGEPAKDIEILSNEEFNSLITTLNKENDIWQTIPLYILLTTGIRTCELCGLTWSDIDFDNKQIHIRRNRIYVQSTGTIVKDLKTKYSKRTLSMCSLLYNKLKEFRDLYLQVCKNNKNFNKEDFVFCNFDGTARFPHYLNKLLSKYLIKAGCKNVSCHKIRHTWITRMISTGASVNAVSKLAGHASSDITLKIYTHYCNDIDNSNQIMERLFAL